MAIVSSTHVVEHAQTDGRHNVIETHTDSAGVEHIVKYLAAVDADYVELRTAHADALALFLAEAEARALADDGV